MLAARRKAQQVEVMEQNALKKLERQAAAEEKVRRAKELERQRAHKKALEDQKKANETFIKLQQLKLNQEKLEKDKQRRAAEKHERKLELKRLREAAERRARQEKKEKEELRRQRNAEFQARVDAMRAEKTRKIAHKARLMEEKEAARLTARRKEEQEIAAKNQAIHLFQAQKCEQAIMRSEQTTERFRNKTMNKTTAADMRWKDLTSKKAAKIQGMRSKLSERSQYVLSRNQAAKDIEQKRINALIERAEKEEERIKLIADRRKREAAMETLERSLSVEEKREKVECMKRYKEYQQAQLPRRLRGIPPAPWRCNPQRRSFEGSAGRRTCVSRSRSRRGERNRLAGPQVECQVQVRDSADAEGYRRVWPWRDKVQARHCGPLFRFFAVSHASAPA